MEAEGDKRSAHGNVRRHVVGIGADAVVRDITDDDSGGSYERTTHYRPLAGPKCPARARDVTRIARGADSEEGHGAGEHVVMQTVVPSEEGAADRVDERAEHEGEKRVAQYLFAACQPRDLADKEMLNGGHSDHDLVNQR